MKIIIKDNKKMMFKDLKPLDVFISGGNYFMKIKNIESSSYSAVLLRENDKYNGEVHTFNETSNLEVEFVPSTIIIGE